MQRDPVTDNETRAAAVNKSCTFRLKITERKRKNCLTCFFSPRIDIHSGQNFLKWKNSNDTKQTNKMFFSKEENLLYFYLFCVFCTHSCTSRKLSSDWSGCLLSRRMRSQYSVSSCSSCREYRVKRGG